MSLMSESELHPLIYNFLLTSKLDKTAKYFLKEIKKSDADLKKELQGTGAANLISIYQSHKKTAPKPAAPVDNSSSSDSDSESSDSEDDEPAKAPVVEAKKAPAAKDNSSSSSSSSDSSDSEDEAPAKKAAPVAKAPTIAAIAAKADSSSSSSSSDSSDSEDEAPAKKAAPAPVAAAKEDSSSSSSSSDSESEDEMKVNNKRKREDDASAATPPAKKAATGASSVEGCVVRVSGMPYEVTEPEVKAFFKGMEITGVDMPTWPDSGRSKGFANLTFASQEDAGKAIAMNGATMGSRWLKIEQHNGRTPFKPGNPGEKPEGCTRVFVGNLSYDIDEETLRAALKDCGTITRLKWGEDRETGDFKGYAHVDFEESESTTKAVALNGEMVCGRAMKCDYAQSSGGNNSSPRNGKKFEVQPMGEKPEGCCTLFIANLSFELTEDSLWEEFGKCGDVKGIRLATDRETGEYRGFGHVEFHDTKAADEAAKLLGKTICGRPIRMDWAKPRAK